MAKPAVATTPTTGRKKRKAEVVEQRLKKYTKVEKGALGGGTGLLESESVNKASRPDYEARYKAFVKFLRGHSIHESAECGQIDAAMVDFADELFFQGKTVSESVAYFDFRFSKDGGGSLPRYRRALRGWKKLGPASSRVGAPEVVFFGTCMVLIGQKEKKMAVWILFTFCCYLRPSECLGLQGPDLVAPVRSATVPKGVWTLTLGPLERGKPTKVGIYDDSVSVGLEPYRQLLGPELQKLNDAATHGENVWGFTYEEIRDSFLEAVVLLRIRHLVYCLYQLRRGGVSADLLRKRREFGEAKKRGRWSTDASVKRYERHAKIQQIISSLPKNVRGSCELSYARMPDVLSGRAAPLKLPVALLSA